MSRKQNHLTAAPRAPVLMQDSRLIRKPAHHPISLARTNSYITRAAKRTEPLNSNDQRSR